ncbi:MAG: GTP-binding protein [Planctomycetota bacterium]
MTAGGRGTKLQPVFDPARTRNIGIVAHIDAGKTTVSERLLFFSGVEPRMGEVHEGSATMDWMAEERRRGITITSAATTLPWSGHQVNLIDTPGHVDFTVEVERCLRVLDGAVLVLSAVSRVQPQSEAVWRQARQFGVPTFVFVNQCDRVGADFMATIADVESRLEVEARPIQYPIGEGEAHRGLVDLVTLEAWEYGRLGEPRAVAVPAEIEDEVGVLREELVERLAELDEAVLEAHVAGREPDPGTLRAALRRATHEGRFQPVLCGAALRNVGMQPLLDAVVNLLPSVADAQPPEALDLASGDPRPLPPDPDAPVCALVFKLQTSRRGMLAFTRVYTGTLRPGVRLLDTRSGEWLEIAGVFRMHADSPEPVDSAGPGDIVALAGMDGASTGDSLCGEAPGLALETQAFSEPVLTQIVEPVLEAERGAVAAALLELAAEDPTLRVVEDRDTGQWLLSGMGELHLEVVEGRLREEFGVRARFGRPSVAFREAVVTTARGEASVEREIGDSVLTGELQLELSPDPGSGRFAVEWEEPTDVEQGLPRNLRAAVEGALARAALFGPRFGFPLIHTRARVLWAEGRGGAEGEQALDQCASIALREAMLGAGVELLEPLVKIEVSMPADHAGAVLALLQRQRTRIGELTTEGSWQTVRGRARLSALEGFSTELRSITQGRGRFGLRPAGFRAVQPEELAGLGLAW